MNCATTITTSKYRIMSNAKTYYLPMEGGLGAQLLTVMLGDYLRGMGAKVIYDLTYFEQKPTPSTPASGVSIWPYELDYYGLERASLSPHQVWPGRIRFWKWLSKKGWSNSYLIDGHPQRLNLLKQALTRGSAGRRFPIRADTLKSVEATTRGLAHYGVIHLRRGDYLNVASHIVADIQVIELLKMLPNLPKVVFITTDGQADHALWQKELPGLEIRHLDAADVFFCHAMMRNAPLLVTANSQFSYTAALLNICANARIYVPRNWRTSDHRTEPEMYIKPDWTPF